MRKSSSYLLWGAVLSSAFVLAAACGNKDGSSGDGDMGDGDGDGDMGDGDGDGDTGDGDGDTGDGDMGGGGGMTNNCPEECSNDGDPCTEDACNPETGECGIPRTGNACDDGIYCNGDDTCDEGECSVHAGDPCSETSCNEGTNACECSQKEHCPGGDLSEHPFGAAGEWGTISFGTASYDNGCDEAASCSGDKTTYECTAGQCVATETEVNDTACETRETDGDACTDNGLYCDGGETCSAGVCNGHTGNPCAGNASTSSSCRESNDSCVDCIDGAGCGTGYKCCNYGCIPDEDTCYIVALNIGQNIVFQNPVLQNPGVFP